MQEENQKAINNALYKKLQQITSKMPHDPILYKPDAIKYLGYFKEELEKVQGDTMKKNQRFGELIIFMARSVKYFPQLLGWIPGTTMKLMEELGSSLHPYLRKKCTGSIMILRARNILLPVSTLQFLLKLMRLQDKQLRSMIYKYVLNDIRRMNKHHQNNKINQQLRAFISSYLPKHTDKTSQKCLKLMIQLYKRNIWTDNRTVNIIAEACFAPSVKLRLMSCYFLMATTNPLEELPDSEDQLVNPSDIKAQKGIVKQTKYKEKQLQKEKRRAERRLRKRQIESRNMNFMPIDLIYNPQVFVEKLFNIMSAKNEKYAHKLIYMSLIARVIWRHELIVLPFYRSLIKYLDPKQKDVHQVLTSLAQSIHHLVPQDEIETIVKHIIQHFVNDRCSQFTMTIGLNTLREVFKKLPSIITEEMMLYLCSYYEYRNKNVSRAAKSVINYVKEYNASLLEKKFRGNDNRHIQAQDENEPEKNTGRILGVELLQQDKKIPLQMDKILTDQDFRKIRRLLKKQEQDQGMSNVYNNQIENEDEEEGKQDQADDEQQQQQEQGSQDDDDDNDEEQLQINSEQLDELQVEDELEQQQQGEQQVEDDLSSDSQIQIAQDDLGMLEWSQEKDDDEKPNKNKNNKTKPIKKDAKDKLKPSGKNARDQPSQKQQSDQEYDQSSEQENPHGFITANQIAYYKMSKTQLKADKKTIKEAKEKFKHTPKEKKGGTTNREKKRLKPLMMVRAKKNKIRKNEKQLKTRIKHLKNQLGKVRSGKEAKKLKNKVVKKTKIK